MAKTRGRVIGGEKLRRFTREALAAKNVRSIEVGFFSTARYPDGTPVTNVAAWNEFGTKGRFPSPERPFFRTAIQEAPDKLVRVMKIHVDSRKLVVDERIAGLLGQEMVNEIQYQITHGDWKDNAEWTIAAKGSSRPLIDTAFMRMSVTHKVNTL